MNFSLQGFSPRCLTRAFAAATLLAAVAMAAQTQQPLPPVHLHPSTSPAATADTAPAPSQPAYTQPTYTKPGYTQPGYTQPGYSQPTSASAPAYAPPSVYVPPTGGATRPADHGEPDDLPPPPADLLAGGPVSSPSHKDIAKPNPKPDKAAAQKAERAATAAQLKAKKDALAAKTQIPPVITKPGEPILDAEGHQVIGPDGKPQFGPTVTQIRDRTGKPVFLNGKPVFQTADNLGFDEHGRKILPVKIVAAKGGTAVSIEHGSFTVDGIVGKVQLDYDIGDLRYLYLYVPGQGVTIVSPAPFPGAEAQRRAFNGNVLTVKTPEHTMQVSSDKPLLGKKPEPAFVLVDRKFHLKSKFPVVGYGTTRTAPYQWPGSKAETHLAGTRVDAPPVPTELKPKLLGAAPPPAVPATPSTEPSPAPDPATAPPAQP